MSEQKTAEQYEKKIKELEEHSRALQDKIMSLSTENRKLDDKARGLERKKEKLLSIIDNLSKGFAVMKG